MKHEAGMNIVLITPMPPQADAPGAIPVLLYAQVRALLARHRLTLVTAVGCEPGEHAALAHLRELGVEVLAAPLAPSQHRWRRRWELASIWLGGRYPWRTAWFHSPLLQEQIDRALATQPVDLVQVEDNAMGVYRLATERPVLFTEYEVRRPRGVAWRKRGGEQWGRWAMAEADWQRWAGYQRTVWRRFPLIQVFTERDAASMAAIAPDVAPRIRVNPFSVTMPPEPDESRIEPNHLLFVGNYTHAPNVDAALWLGRELLPLIRRHCPEARLSLVGIYPPPEVQALGEQPGIEVTGAVPEIEPWFARAAVVVAPLRIGGGMRMKVLQALAMGKAVVTTARGAEGLAVAGQAPPLLVADDAAELAGAVAALLSVPAARQALGRQARAFVEQHFSPAAFADRLEAIYRELIAPGEVHAEHHETQRRLA